MTPGEVANCGLALEQVMKKTKVFFFFTYSSVCKTRNLISLLRLKRFNADLKEVDKRLKDSGFPSAAAFLEAVVCYSNSIS